MKYTRIFIWFLLVSLWSCSVEEITTDQDFAGTWKIESVAVINNDGKDISTILRIPNLTGARLHLDVGHAYYTTDNSTLRNNKVFQFLFFADPKYFIDDSTKSFGTWEVLGSGDLMFERGTNQITTTVLEHDGTNLVLQTYTEFDLLENGYEYFYKLGRVAGRERASAASGQTSYNDGFKLGEVYGFAEGYRERFNELSDAANFEDWMYYAVGDPLYANAQGYLTSVDQDLSNTSPTFNLGFTDAYADANTEGRTTANEVFGNRTVWHEIRVNYRLVYHLIRSD